MLLKKITFSLWLAVVACYVNAQQPQFQEIKRIYGNESDPPGFEHPQKMIKLSDGNMIIAGDWRDSALLIKINGAGDTLWNRRYKLDAVSGFNTVLELPGGTLAAAGYCKPSATGATKILVVTITANGTLTNTYTAGNINQDAEVKDMILNRAGELVCTGLYNTNLNNNKEDAFFLRLTTGLALPAGATIKPIHAGHYEKANSIIELNGQTGYMIAGLLRTSGSNQHYAFMARLNAAGDTVWTRRSTYTPSEFYVIKQQSTNEPIVAGYRKVDVLQKNDGYLAAVNISSGNFSRQEHYGSPNYNDDIRDFAFVNNGLLVGGNYGMPRCETGANIRAWVFRLDAGFDVIETNYWDDYLLAYSLRSLVVNSADAQDFAFVAQHYFFGIFDIMYLRRGLNGHTVTLTHMPKHFQLYPRKANDSALVQVAGTVQIPLAPGYTQMRLKVYRNGTQLSNNYIQNLAYSGNTAGFSFQVPIKSELADYDFKLYGYSALTGEQPEAEALGVVAGDVFIIQGQSNAVADLGAAHPYNALNNRFVRTFGLKQNGDTVTYVWHREAGDDGAYNGDRKTGLWGLVMAEKLATTYNRPVAVLNGGISGIPIDSMLPGAFNQSYRKFLKRVKQSGLLNDAKAILFFQGESDAVVFNTETVDSYKAKFNTLNNAWYEDFPLTQHRYLFQIRPGALAVGGMYEAAKPVQEAQRQLAGDIPQTRILSTSGMNHDGIHYFLDNGYRRAGEDLYRLVAHDLYADTTEQDIYPAEADTLYFSNPARTEITIKFKGDRHTLTGYAGYEKDFFVEGDTARCKVIGYSVVNNQLVLQLNTAPAASFTGFTFSSHIGTPTNFIYNAGAPVKNARGIGLLCFYNRPVGPYVPGMVQVQIAQPATHRSGGQRVR